MSGAISYAHDEGNEKPNSNGSTPASDIPPVEDDLKRRFPRTLRHIVRDDFLWILFFLIVVTVTLIFAPFDPMLPPPAAVALTTKALYSLLVATAVLVSFRLLYSLLRHVLRRYKIRGDRIHFGEGVLIKVERVTFINKLIEVSIGKKFTDVIFYLSYIRIAIIGEPDVIITGFSPPVSRFFQKYLIDTIEKTNALSPSAQVLIPDEAGEAD